MPIMHEVATMTAKGQITLPKAIRQALGVDVGAKVAFELLEGGQIVVSRADAEHEDPAIGSFLDLLANDIKAARHIRGLPDDLAQSMREHARHEASPDEDIDGDVEL
ncbi:MAG: type II toxin-antitoxin system PrlF family antitoxin [Gammaproteobacteria bacterium]|nr:type II toxin-antitoxin system PrlF family antitoxin [Gammaproteobacteria bacterium]MCY4340308.1 type II toxin-antitoxin system PrlF family antitoxin [Gammaproteobacteria bacterium]